jgi:hypothetical protein
VLRGRYRNPANPGALGFGAHIDQLDARVALQQQVGFMRRHGAGIRLVRRARAGFGEDLFNGLHAIFQMMVFRLL